MLKHIRQNPMIAAGILLPLIIVVFFLLATAIPRWLVAPPEYDFVFTVPEHNPSRRDVELTIDVVDNRLRARLFKKNDYYRGIARLYVFEHETQDVREISINIPGDLESFEDGAEIIVPEFADRSISTNREAPDGYELLGPGYGRGDNLMTALFGGHRRYQLSIHKAGAVVEIPSTGDHRNYYYSATFLGWVTK